jgi:hypothetical protein
MTKDIILCVKAPFLYGLTLQFCFTIEVHLSGLKSHDHMNLLRVCMSNTWFFFYSVGKNILYTHSFMEISNVCVYFVVSLSFSHVWLYELWLPLGSMTCHIKIICNIFTLNHIKGDLYGYHSMVASRYS